MKKLTVTLILLLALALVFGGRILLKNISDL